MQDMKLTQAMNEMFEGTDRPQLSVEEQYERVIQALIKQIKADQVWIAPNEFAEANSLHCSVDGLGNICLTTKKATLSDAPSGV